MNREKYTKKSKRYTHNVMYWVVGILLVLTMLSAWLVSGLFAKYVISSYMMDSARVAKTGIGTMKLLEHEAKLNSGIYVLDENEEVTENKYETVIPGVDIAKDPFVRLDINSELAFELYVQVVKSTSFPSETVTYELTEDWIEIDATNGIYKYKYAFEAGTPVVNKEISILKNDELKVSELYEGKNQGFELKFNAWLVQAGAN